MNSLQFYRAKTLTLLSIGLSGVMGSICVPNLKP